MIGNIKNNQLQGCQGSQKLTIFSKKTTSYKKKDKESESVLSKKVILHTKEDHQDYNEETKQSMGNEVKIIISYTIKECESKELEELLNNKGRTLCNPICRIF